MSLSANSDEAQDTLQEIFQHAQSSIERIADGKIFLHPDKVGLYLGKIYVGGKPLLRKESSICSILDFATF